jgi:hypothetical protein
MSAFHVFCSEWPYEVFRNTLMTLLWSSVALIALWALLSCPWKQQPSAFWQADSVCLNVFSLFVECVCIHCFDCSLVSTFTNETRVSSLVTRMMWLRNSPTSLWYRSKNVKAEAILHEQAEFRCHCLTLLIRILQVRGPETEYPYVLAVFLILSRQVLGYYLKSGNNRYLPYIFKFIIH